MGPVAGARKLQTAAADSLQAYKGTSKVFGEPARITDPDDRAGAELEIGGLKVSDFDLVWCIDSTGSMNEPNQLVARETGQVIRVCGLISRKARCGTVYFRHEIVPELMKPCCVAVGNNPASTGSSFTR